MICSGGLLRHMLLTLGFQFFFNKNVALGFSSHHQVYLCNKNNSNNTVCKDLPIAKNLVCPAHCYCCLATTGKIKDATTNSSLEDFGFLNITCEQDKGLISNDTHQLVLDRLLHQLPWLERLSISGAAFSYIPQSICNMSSMRSLQLDNNMIQELEPTCFSSMRNLKVIQLSNNLIQDLPSGMFEGLERLRKVVLSHNRIDSIGKEVFSKQYSFQSLTLIDLSYNMLEELDPWPIVRFISTEGVVVNLEHNRIKQMTNNIGWNTTLESFINRSMTIWFPTLKLSDNNLTNLHTIPKVWNMYDMTDRQVPELTVFIEAFNNPIHCDCMVAIPLSKCHIDYTKHLCNSPESVRGRSMLDVITMSFRSAEQHGIACPRTDQCPDGCQCLQNHEAYSVLTVHCLQTGLYDLPLMLPPLPVVPYSGFKCRAPYRSDPCTVDYKYIIELKEKGLLAIHERDYLNEVSYLSITSNGIRSISAQAFQQLKNNKYLLLDLTGNNFEKPPTELKIFEDKISDTFRVDLRRNPWICNCDSKWFKRWLFSVSTQTKDRSIYQNVLCTSPKSLKDLPLYAIDDTLWCDTSHDIKKYIAVGLGSVIGIIFLFVLSVIVLYFYRYAAFRKFKWRIFERDECVGEDVIFDVFISYASEDEEAVLEIYDWLHNEEGYKCCIHKYDFMAGCSILENIGQAIQKSKRTLCFLSPHFLQSQMCLWEFEMALNQDVEKRKRRLIAILLEDFDRQDVPGFISLYMAKFTYIEYQQEDLKNNILFNLTTNKMGTVANDEHLEGHEEQIILDNYM